jgi:hypothetical protein
MRHLLAIALLSLAVQAQNFTVTSNSAFPDASIEPSFWTIENRVNVSILAGLVSADAITTQRGLNQGLREANPIMRPFAMRGALRQAAGSALGLGAAVGVAYLLHQTHHFKAERVAMRLMVAGEGGFVANNAIVLR